MTSIIKLANTLDKLKEKYEIDEIDIKLLATLSGRWNVGREVRVTDLTIVLGKELGSPANLHYRITKALVDAKLIKLKVSKEDARVKHIVQGAQFYSLTKFLEGL
jgi:hypothetical protein